MNFFYITTVLNNNNLNHFLSLFFYASGLIQVDLHFAIVIWSIYYPRISLTILSEQEQTILFIGCQFLLSLLE